MTDLMEKAMASVSSWPARQQDEAAEILLALDRLGAGGYVASKDELIAIDEALAQIEAGEFAPEAEIEAACASHDLAEIADYLTARSVMGQTRRV
jgi:hypothetical protein